MKRQTCFHCRVFFDRDVLATKKIPLHKVNVCDVHYMWMTTNGRVAEMPPPEAR